MIQIGESLVSLELFEEQFVCDLSACKGACCVEGDGGAPLTKAEVKKMEEILPDVWGYLNEKGKAVIEEKGVYIRAADGDLETPLVGNKECAFVVFDETNTAKCGIEQAYNDGLTDFKKPISCHLYPIREANLSIGTALNYHQWQICSAACTMGKELKVPVFKFLKEALIRKYGEDWYKEAEMIHDLLQKEGRI